MAKRKKMTEPSVAVQLGNWMLLSTIDAVHRNQLMLADYHFRWFGTTVRT